MLGGGSALTKWHAQLPPQASSKWHAVLSDGIELRIEPRAPRAENNSVVGTSHRFDILMIFSLVAGVRRGLEMFRSHTASPVVM